MYSTGNYIQYLIINYHGKLNKQTGFPSQKLFTQELTACKAPTAEDSATTALPSRHFKPTLSSSSYGSLHLQKKGLMGGAIGRGTTGKCMADPC